MAVFAYTAKTADGKKVESTKGDGIVVRHNILKQTVLLRRSEDDVEVEVSLEDLVAKKSDAE